MNCSIREITYEQLGQEKQQTGDIFLVGMDVVRGGDYVFQWTETARNEQNLSHQTVSRMIYSNLGTEVSAVDLWESYLEKNIATEEFYESTVIPQGYCVCDSEGNTCIKTGENQNGYTELYVFDRAGQAVMEYRCDAEQGIGERMRMESGELVFPVLDPHEENYTFLWPDTSTGEMRKLGQLSSSQQIEKLYGMQGNSVYYQVSEGIIKWDIQSGKRNLVFSFRENGVPGG